MAETLKIAISGKSGCGNTTVSRLAAAALGVELINVTFRDMAAEKGMTLEAVLALAKADDAWDKELDARQTVLARKAAGCVLGSRLAIWMLPEADFKVYLRASGETRACRIMRREGGSLPEVAAFTEARDRQDRERYLRIYGIDNDDYAFADCIIDTDTLPPEEIAARIVAQAKAKRNRQNPAGKT